jgi:hypothetical protein
MRQTHNFQERGWVSGHLHGTENTQRLRAQLDSDDPGPGLVYALSPLRAYLSLFRQELEAADHRVSEVGSRPIVTSGGGT